MECILGIAVVGAAMTKSTSLAVNITLDTAMSINPMLIIQYPMFLAY